MSAQRSAGCFGCNCIHQDERIYANSTGRRGLKPRLPGSACPKLWAGIARVRAYKARLPNQDAIPILRE